MLLLKNDVEKKSIWNSNLHKIVKLYHIVIIIIVLLAPTYMYNILWLEDILHDTLYSAVPLQCGQYSLKYSEQTPNSSLMGELLGVFCEHKTRFR